jgi:hypothetical protein
MKEFGWFAVIAGAVILEALTAPGTGLSGQSWKLSRSDAPGMVRFTVERARPGSRSLNSSDVPLANFHGFSLGMLDHGGPAKFTYVLDAATLQCEGKYSWGRGFGSFTLTPNPEFVAELNRLGFASPREDELFLMVLSNINLDFVREVRSANIATSLRDILDMAAHGVNSQYIHDVNRTGYRNLRAQDYIDLKDHGVEARFIEALKEAGYQLPSNEVIEMKDHGVDSEYIRALRGYDLRPDATELVALRDHGVTPEFLRGFRDAGYGAIPADQTIELKDHGVDREFVAEAHDLGYRFTPAELIELHDHGVDGKYLRTIHDSGMKNLNAGQIVQLHDHGVE